MIFRGDGIDSYRSFDMERRIQRNLKRIHNNTKVYLFKTDITTVIFFR